MSLGSFSFGIFLYYLLKEESFLNFFRAKKINAVTVFSVCLLLISLMTVYPQLPVQIHVYCFLFLVLALMLSQRPWKILVNPLTVLIGRISYSAYLFHFFALKAITLCLTQFFPGILHNQNGYFITVLLLGMVVTYPFAWCGYHFIELPAINFSKRLIQKFENKEKELQVEGRPSIYTLPLS